MNQVKYNTIHPKTTQKNHQFSSLILSNEWMVIQKPVMSHFILFFSFKLSHHLVNSFDTKWSIHICMYQKSEI